MTSEKWYTDAAHLTNSPGSPLRTISFTYDANSRLLSSSDPVHTYTYEYDNLNRLTKQRSQIAGLTPIIEFTSGYDANGNRTSLSTIFDASTDYGDFANAYTYDVLNRLTSLTQQSAVTAHTDHAVAAKRVDFAYDLAGQLDWIKRYASTSTTSAVAVTDYTFDGAGLVEEILHNVGSTPGSGTLRAGYGYTWNAKYQITAIDFLNSDYNDEDVAYTYDSRGQLTGVDYAGLTDESYAYDDNGNRTSVTNAVVNGNGGTDSYTTAADNRLESDGQFRYKYDNEGNRTHRYIDANSNGYLDSGDTILTEYLWDHRNRPWLVADFEQVGGTYGFQALFYYDAHNQLVKRLVDPDGGTGSAAWQFTVYVWEAGQIVLQFDKSSDGLTAADLSHRYLWGPGTDQLLVDEAVASLSDAGQNERLWALTDHLGTIRDIVQDDGTVRLHRAFDSFGRVTDAEYFDSSGDPVAASHADAIDTAFEWQGHLKDKWTGLLFTDARPYDPNTGQFISQDPSGFPAGYTNLYVMVGNKVTTYTDSDGRQEREAGRGGERGRRPVPPGDPGPSLPRRGNPRNIRTPGASAGPGIFDDLEEFGGGMCDSVIGAATGLWWAVTKSSFE